MLFEKNLYAKILQNSNPESSYNQIRNHGNKICNFFHVGTRRNFVQRSEIMTPSLDFGFQLYISLQKNQFFLLLHLCFFTI